MKRVTNLLLAGTLLITVIAVLRCTDWDLTDSSNSEQIRLQITTVTDSSVTLLWNRSHDDNFRCYKIYYSAFNDVPDTTDKVADTLYLSIDTVKTVYKLDANKRYYFRVMVHTTLNRLKPSNIVDTVTLKSMKEYVIRLLTPDSSAITESSVLLQWQPNWTDKYAKFFIYYDTTATVDSLDTVCATVNDGTSCRVQNLKIDKQYWFRVYTERSGKPFAGSNSIGIRTLTGKPKPVLLDSLSNADIGVSDLRLHWASSKDADFWRYIVYWDTIVAIDTNVLSDTLNPKIKIIKQKMDTVYTLGHLASNHLYYVTLFVQDTMRLRTQGNTISGRTKTSFPTPAWLIDTAATGTFRCRYSVVNKQV